MESVPGIRQLEACVAPTAG